MSSDICHLQHLCDALSRVELSGVAKEINYYYMPLQEGKVCTEGNGYAVGADGYEISNKHQ